MKFYIFWKGIKDKSDYNIVIDDSVDTYDISFLPELAADLGKTITRDTKVFGIAK